jgi:hypothetical protein
LIISVSTRTTKNITPSHPIQTTIETIESPKDPKESEQEDLRVALELFLDKSDEELQNFFLDHHFWEEDIQTLTLSIPIEELAEMGYVPQELSAKEYGPILQWSVEKKQNQWITPENTPQKI